MSVSVLGVPGPLEGQVRSVAPVAQDTAHDHHGDQALDQQPSASCYVLASDQPDHRLQSVVDGTAPVGGYSLKDPQEISAALYDYTVKYHPNIKRLHQTLSDALDVSHIPELRCVRDGTAMSEILTNHNQYKTVRDFFSALEKKQYALIECLNLGQKLKYGPRIKSLFGKFNEQIDFINSLCAVYAGQRGVSMSAGIVDVMTFILNRGRLDPDGQKIFDVYCARLSDYAGRLLESPRVPGRYFRFLPRLFGA
ncbi:MAG: hypothetical protein HQM16_03770 [Deltaproteobacteria bacterium]|nr:hypothetical protein [Deltaproteobacteria bacterium]